MNNSIIKFLINLKNASVAKKEFLDIQPTKAIKNLIHLLYSEGLLQSYTYDSTNDKIRITFRFVGNFSVLDKLKLYSTPSKQIFLTLKDIHKIKTNHKLIVVSTVEGFKNASQCKQICLGGVACFSC